MTIMSNERPTRHTALLHLLDLLIEDSLDCPAWCAEHDDADGPAPLRGVHHSSSRVIADRVLLHANEAADGSHEALVYLADVGDDGLTLDQAEAVARELLQLVADVRRD